MIVHGYLGYKASKEMEQYFTTGELRRIAYYEEGLWNAPLRSTFKSYLPDICPERPYIILQNSPLDWSILAYIHYKQNEVPAVRASTNGLVCVCLQTYNTRICGIQNRKLESISLALEVMAQEVVSPNFITCDQEGAFQQLAQVMDSKGMEKLEENIKYNSDLQCQMLTSRRV